VGNETRHGENLILSGQVLGTGSPAESSIAPDEKQIREINELQTDKRGHRSGAGYSGFWVGLSDGEEASHGRSRRVEKQAR